MSEKAKYVINSIITPAVIAMLVVFGSGLVGNQLAKLGAIGITRFPNSGIAVRGINISTTMPSSVTDNTLTVGGTSTLNIVSVTGTTTLATTTISGSATLASTTITNLASTTITRLRITGTTTLGTTLTPSASTSVCTAGDFVWDTAYIYTCIGTNNWRRASTSGGNGPGW